MAVDILALGTIVTRLKSQVPALKAVEGAAELDAAMKGGVRIAPACFVIAAKEQSSTVTEMANAVRQRVVDYFDVVYAIKNVSSRGGEEGVDGGLRTIRIAAMQALLGWEPSPAFAICKHESGALISLGGGMIWWKDRFFTDHYNSAL